MSYFAIVICYQIIIFTFKASNYNLLDEHLKAIMAQAIARYRNPP